MTDGGKGQGFERGKKKKNQQPTLNAHYYIYLSP